MYPASSDANADRRTKDGDKASKVIPDDSAIHLEAWAHQNTNANASKSWKEKPINLIPDSPPFKPVPGNGVQFSDLSKNLDETFKKIDKDKNGFVTHDELRIATADHSYKGDAAMTVALLKANQAGPSRNSIGWLNPDPQSDSPLKGISPKDAKLYFDMLSLAQKEKISNFRLFNKYESQLSSIEFYKLIDPNRDSKITIKELQDASKAKDLPTERKELVDLLLRNHSFLSTLGVQPGETVMTTDSISYLSSLSKTIGFEDEHRTHSIVERQRTTEHNNKLFADETKPVESIKREAVQQGLVGDCFFLSAVGAVAQSDPESLAKMITKTETGEYKVKFPGANGKEVTVPAPTETELILYAGATKHGAWVNLLEKAYGQLLNENPEFRTAEFIDKVPSPENLDNGGEAEALAMLTGRKPTTYVLEPSTEASLKALSNRLSEAKKNGEIAIALTVFDDKIRPEITPGHAYTVVDFDENSVTIRNSWSVRYLGMKDGLPYVREGDDGITKIPLKRCPELLHTLSFAPGKKK